MTARAWLLFGVMSVLWGLPYLLIKIAVGELSPAVIGLVASATAFGLLAPVAVRRGGFRGIRSRLGWVVAQVVLQATAPFLLIPLGEQHIASSLAGLLVATQPLFVAVLALWVDPTERVSGGRLLGLLVGLLGVAALLGVDVRGDQLALLGAGMVLVASLGYAGSALLFKLRLGHLSSVGVAATALLISTLFLMVPAALTLPATMPSRQAIAAVLVLGVVVTGGGWLGFYALIGEAGASRATLISYVTPAVAVLLGVVALHEKLAVTTIAGFALIIAGSWLATGAVRVPVLSRG